MSTNFQSDKSWVDKVLSYAINSENGLEYGAYRILLEMGERHGWEMCERAHAEELSAKVKDVCKRPGAVEITKNGCKVLLFPGAEKLIKLTEAIV